MCTRNFNHYLIYFATPPVATPVQEYPVSSSVLYYFLDNVECTGHEDRLNKCEHNGVGNHNCYIRYEQAGVICNSKKASYILYYYSNGLFTPL